MNIKNIGLLTLIFATTGNAQQDYSRHCSLSSESKSAIVVSSLKGGVAALSTYLFGYWLSHDYTFPKLSEHRLAYAMWPAIGATIMALWRSSYVPESYFDYAQSGILQISNDPVLNVIMNTENETVVVAQLKDYFFRHSFPLSAAFRYLNLLYENLQLYYDSLQEVMQSYRIDLQQESLELILIIDIYQNVIKDTVKLLKEDPNFIAECNAQTMVDMQHAQIAAAQAAESGAVAAWVSALDVTPTNQIIVL